MRDKLRQEGFSVELTNGGHWEVRGENGRRVTTFPQTPSDRRWKLNAESEVKRWKREQGIAV
jgi:hypothetical protein